jgi:hypothetical protein
MNSAVIFYHSNIASLYRKEWINACIDSIKNQTYKNFGVIELNYGGGQEKYCDGKFQRYFFLNQKLENHICALNYLHDLAFSSGYDVVFNVNMDDRYAPDRFQKQIEAISGGAELVSSNFLYIDGKDNVIKGFEFDRRDIKKELDREHNIFCHPVISMHRNFWTDGMKYNESLIGSEDLDLWKRGAAAGKNMVILPDYLCFYRIHDKQITRKFRKS